MPIEVTSLTPLIQVFDMPRSLVFYRDILGFEVVSDSGNGDESSWVWLRKNGCDLMLNDQYEPGQVPDNCPPDRVKWHNDACIYLGCHDLDSTYDHLASKGIDVEPPFVTSYGMKQFYVRDPDNYGLCFQLSADTDG